MPCYPRGPDGDRHAVASRPRSRSRRRSTRARGGRCRPAGPPTAEANVPRSSASSLSTRRMAFWESGAEALAARTQERFFASQVTAGGPIWPRGAPRPHRSSSSQIPENCVNAANSWIPRVGDPGLEPGTSSLSGKPLVASSRPNSNLIPANTCNRAHGRRLETTGRYNLVAPSWPHDRSSRVSRRVAGKRTSCRRYGQARTLRRRAAAPSRSCAPAAIFGARSGPSARGDSAGRGERPGATFSAALAMPPRRHRLPFASGGGGAVEKPVPPRMISRQASC